MEINTTSRKRQFSEFDAEAFSSIALVVCVARTSSHRDVDFVDKLRSNNQKLYDKFQKRIHPTMHSCENQCAADFKSIVYNGYSSNTNMNTYQAKPLKELKAILEEYAVRAIVYNNTAVIIFSQQDGLFTNVRGFKECFEPYEKYRITLCMYTGGSKFQQFSIREMLTVVRACENGGRVEGPHYELLSDWVKVSLNKENMAHMARDNKKIMARKRNTIDDDSDDEPAHVEKEPMESPTIIREYTQDSMLLRRQANAEKSVKIKRYEFEGDEEYMECPEEGCRLRFDNFELLIKHILENCIATQTCVLCPTKPVWTKSARNGKTHIQCHFPATLKCQVADCIYTARTDSAMARHEKSHGEGIAKNHKCTQCDFSSNSAENLRRHIDTHTGNGDVMEECKACGMTLKRKSMPNHRKFLCVAQPGLLYECPECKDIFDNYHALARHKVAIHDRRDQVIGFAVDAGFVQAGDMAKSASEMVR